MTVAEGRGATTVSSPDAGDEPATTVGADDRSVVWLVAAALVVVAVTRAWVITRVQVAVIVPDEAGAWSIARLLAGVEPTLPMRDVPVYPLFTGVLLAPVVHFFRDPVTSYRIALVLLAGLVVGAGALFATFVRQVAGRSRQAAAASFALVVLYPATAITSTYSWSEAAVVAGLALLLVATHVAYRGLRTGPVLAAAAVAGAMPSVHGRFLLVPALWAVCTAVYVLRAPGVAKRRRFRLVAAMAVVVAVVAVAGALASKFVVHRLWTVPAEPGRGLVGMLFEPTFWGRFSGQVIGQIWYALASSFGLAALGSVWLVRKLRERQAPRSTTATLAVTAAVSVAVFLTSVTTVAKGLVQLGKVPAGRLDYYVHGRYIDAVVLLLAVLGLPELLDRERRAAATRVLLAAVGIIVVTGLVTVLTIPAGLTGFLGPAIAGVYELPFVSAFSVVRWSIVAGLAILLVALATRVRRRLSVAVVGVLLVLMCWSASARAIQDHHDFARFALFRHVPAATDGRDKVVVAADALQQRRYRLGSFSQEYVLTAKGWEFEFADASSGALVDLDDPRAGVLVLLRHEPVDLSKWKRAGSWGEVDVWVRV